MKIREGDIGKLALLRNNQLIKIVYIGGKISELYIVKCEVMNNIVQLKSNEDYYLQDYIYTTIYGKFSQLGIDSPFDIVKVLSYEESIRKYPEYLF